MMKMVVMNSAIHNVSLVLCDKDNEFAENSKDFVIKFFRRPFFQTFRPDKKGLFLLIIGKRQRGVGQSRWPKSKISLEKDGISPKFHIFGKRA